MLPALPTDREALAAQQGIRLATLLRTIHGHNRFYTRKLADAGVDVRGLTFPRDLALLPVTRKADLVVDQDANPPWGTAHTESLDRYTRYCQTSSTTGRPLKWLDTSESWQWMVECWKAVYRGARIGRGDRVFFPFSFGPFLGFWVGFEAGCQAGLLCVPVHHPEHMAKALLGQFRIGRAARDHDDAGLLVQRGCRDGGARAEVSGDENDTVGDQLARRGDALLALAVIIDRDQFDRLAEEAACLVEFGHSHRDAPFVLLAEPRHGAGERPRCPDPDLGVRGQRNEEDRNSRTQQYACPEHDHLPL